jgi:hypothetical protein
MENFKFFGKNNKMFIPDSHDEIVFKLIYEYHSVGYSAVGEHIYQGDGNRIFIDICYFNDDFVSIDYELYNINDVPIVRSSHNITLTCDECIERI